MFIGILLEIHNYPSLIEMISKPIDLPTMQNIITTIRKNELGLPSDVIDRFLNDLYFQWLQQKVDSLLNQ